MNFHTSIIKPLKVTLEDFGLEYWGIRKYKDELNGKMSIYKLFYNNERIVKIYSNGKIQIDGQEVVCNFDIGSGTIYAACQYEYEKWRNEMITLTSLGFTKTKETDYYMEYVCDIGSNNSMSVVINHGDVSFLINSKLASIPTSIMYAITNELKRLDKNIFY